MTLTEACHILLDSHTNNWQKDENFTVLSPRYSGPGFHSQKNYLDAWGVIRDHVVEASNDLPD